MSKNSGEKESGTSEAGPGVETLKKQEQVHPSLCMPSQSLSHSELRLSKEPLPRKARSQPQDQILLMLKQMLWERTPFEEAILWNLVWK